MIALLTSPHLIDLILILTVLEGIALITWQQKPAGGIVALLLPGMCLMVAIRTCLAGAPWPWLPLALLAALVTHLIDLRRRFRAHD